MVILRAQTELKMGAGQEASAPTSILWFDSTTPETDVDEIFAAITDAYNSVSGDLSGQVDNADHRVRIYDMSDPEPRAPIFDDTFSLVEAPSGSSLPPQCSMVISFQGVRVSGVQQARRRGRVYIGPLDVSSVGTTGLLTSTCVGHGINWAQDMLTASLDATTWNWVVWSRVNESATVITNGWIDNRVDTQRRRSADATSRTLWAPAP